MAKQVKSSAKKEQDSINFLKKMGMSFGSFRGGEKVSTGHFSLDFALKYGELPTNINLDAEKYDTSPSSIGLPLGVIVEFSGGPGSGKSSLAYRICGNAQKMGFTTAWIDAENSFSEDLADINGCNPYLMITPKMVGSAEEYLETMKALLTVEKCPWTNKDGKTETVDAPKIIVLDSIASLVPSVISERDVGQQTMGVLPALLSDHLKDIANYAIEKQVLIILINQLRDNLSPYGSATKTPGGNSVKFHSSVRIEMRKNNSKEKMIYETDEMTNTQRLIAGLTSVSIKKNRLGKPFLDSFEIPVYYEKVSLGIASFAFLAARQLKILSVRLGVFNWRSRDIKINGKEEFIKYLKDEDMLNVLIKEIMDESEKCGYLMPPEINRYASEDESYLSYIKNLQLKLDNNKKIADTSNKK